jgi:hypothetical protein
VNARSLALAPLAMALAVSWLAIATGCSRTPDAVAYQNRVFYEGEAGADVNLKEFLEKPYAPLDGTSPPELEHEGVEILDGVARLSRPKDWIIRQGSNRPEGRFIEYVSPRQVVFGVYERLESPKDTWSLLIERYKADTEKQGGVFLGEGVPFSSWDTQARAFDVKRGVPAGPEPLVSYSREYLARSPHRVVLIQIVRPREEYGAAEAEFLRVMTTLSVL